MNNDQKLEVLNHLLDSARSRFLRQNPGFSEDELADMDQFPEDEDLYAKIKAKQSQIFRDWLAENVTLR